MTMTIREPGSAFTHLAGIVLTMAAAIPLLIAAYLTGSKDTLLGMSGFVLSMILLYTASTVYHAVSVGERALRVFRKLDHMMIFVLIAGSYMPICLQVLRGMKGYLLLACIWGLALIGMILKACWITCPNWLSSVIYILMGWMCAFVFKDLHGRMSPGAFGWLLAGGIVYTIGGVIYAIALPLFPPKKYFGNHELFHLFVLGGSFCHFVSMFLICQDTGTVLLS